MSDSILKRLAGALYSKISTGDLKGGLSDYAMPELIDNFDPKDLQAEVEEMLAGKLTTICLLVWEKKETIPSDANRTLRQGHLGYQIKRRYMSDYIREAKMLLLIDVYQVPYQDGGDFSSYLLTFCHKNYEFTVLNTAGKVTCTPVTEDSIPVAETVKVNKYAH